LSQVVEQAQDMVAEVAQEDLELPLVHLVLIALLNHH
jgi:hypothetical protein